MKRFVQYGQKISSVQNLFYISLILLTNWLECLQLARLMLHVMETYLRVEQPSVVALGQSSRVNSFSYFFWEWINMKNVIKLAPVLLLDQDSRMHLPGRCQHMELPHGCLQTAGIVLLKWACYKNNSIQFPWTSLEYVRHCLPMFWGNKLVCWTVCQSPSR